MQDLIRLLALMSRFKKWVLLSILLGFATIASAIGLMGTSAYLISRAALQPSIAVLQVAIVGVRFFGISRGIFRYLERLVSHSVNLRILTRLRRWFYETLEPLLPASGLELQSGDLLERMLSDIDTLENFYIRVVSPSIIALMVTSGMGILLGQFHVQLALVTVAGLLVSGVSVPLISQMLRRKSGAQMLFLRGRLSSTLTEQIQGMRDLLAYQQEEYKIAQLEEIDNQFSKAQTHFIWRESLVESLNSLLPGMTLLVSLIVAIPLVYHGELEGVMLAVVTLMTLSSFEAAAPLGAAAQNLEISLQAASRIFSLLKLQPEVHLSGTSLPLDEIGSIDAKNLSFAYSDTGASTLQDISFHLTAGKRIAVIGASGAGKSTLLNLLLRFWETKPGMLSINGQDIQNFLSTEVRKNFAVISSRGHIFSQTLRQNMLLADPQATDEQIAFALQQVQLNDWLTALPHGLDTLMGEWGQYLSGGEKQRLLIARAILQSASVWLLDEPTVHLDATNEKEINELLWQITSDHSTIWISHHPFRLQEMDEILVFQEGQIIERGRHQDLMALNGYYTFQYNWLNRIIPD